MALEGNIRTRATQAFEELREALHAFVLLQPDGVRNDEVARELGLETSFKGGQRNYLTFSVLNTLVAEGRLLREKRGSRIYYVAGTASSA